MATTRSHIWRKFALLTAILALLAAPTATADGGRGKYSRWTAQWWQWVFSLPVSDNPLFDETGDKAGTDQPNKKVFFLVGVINESGTATREITVPKGTPLFGPIINTETDNIGVDDPLTAPELRARAEEIIDTATGVYLRVDGELRPDLVDRIQSPVFSYTLPAEDNIYQFFGIDVSGRVKPAVSDGYWFYIPPLAVGEHTIEFGGGLDQDANGEPDFTVAITYKVTVE